MSRLVGRSNELWRARSLLEGQGVVVLVGPSGVGKTALCDVLAEEWTSRGGTVRELRGTHGLKRFPFGALALGLRVDPGESDSETLTRVVAMLQSEARPMVVVDDAHLLDPETAGVVSGLAQSGDIALALTLTSGESVSADITSVWTRWPQCRLEVDPLDRAGVAELLSDILDRPPSDVEVDETVAVSLGYPLYVTAVAYELAGSDGMDLRSLLASGSSRLTSLLERRLARLDSHERKLFDAIAFAESTAGEIALAGEDPGVLEKLHEGGLIKLAGGRVQVAHPLLGSVSRGAMTSDGQRSSARRLVEGLSDSSEPGDVAAIVRKALDVGVIPKVDLLKTTAEVALGWGDFAGVARIASISQDDPGLLVLRARAARFLGETPSTEIPVGLDEADLTEYLSGTSQGLAYGERRFSDAIDFLKEGMSAITQDENRNRLALELMVLSGLVGDIDSLLGAARTVSRMSDPATRLLAFSATQLAEALTLSTVTSEDTYQQGAAIIGAGGVDSFLAEQLEMSRIMVEFAEGRFRQARERSRTFTERVLPGSWLTIEAVVADAWLPLGEASKLADSAVTTLEEFDPLANLAQARIVADLRRAQSGKSPRDDGSDVQREPGVADIDRIMNERVDAWMAWALDDSTAAKRLVEVGRDAVSKGHRFWGLSAFIDATRLGLGTEVTSDIEQLVITRGAGLAILAGRFARAETSDELWDVAQMWWEAGAPVYAIEAAIRATRPDDPRDCFTVHLMEASGASPVVGDTVAISNPATKRQTEIVLRLIAGRPNDQIAEDLFISRRTVENHLHRLYKTIEINEGREELTSRLGWLATPNQ